MEGTTNHRKLVRISIDGLLGRFEHTIDFKPDRQFLIIHGPNGVGKTRLLELMHSVFAMRYDRLASIPFARARFEFDDANWIEVARNKPSAQAQLPIDGEPTRIQVLHEADTLIWRSSLFDSEIELVRPSSKHRHEHVQMIEMFEDHLPVDQIDFNVWRDLPTGDILGPPEVAERYRSRMQPFLLKPRTEDMSSKLEPILESHKVHLIETQRLLGTNLPLTPYHRASTDSHNPKPTVVSYASNLSHKLNAALASNSRTSQARDRSFPSRLFQEIPIAAEHELRDRYAKQLELRSRLTKIAILDSSTDLLKLPERPLEDWECRVLQIYLDDADAKLQTFQPLLDRLELLQEIVNERLLFKNLEFNQKQGFNFIDDDTTDTVDLRHLSSGEQHEIVLLYDLLMNVHEHTLVLIDEPEISLHVAWQKKFLNDLDRISSLTSLRFVIATHSPQIVDKWWDHTVELYTRS